MKAKGVRFFRMINERIVSELLAFWRAGVYRLKALMEGPKRSELGKESSNLIVFVHGYLADSSCWRPWMQHLGHRGHQVAAVDLGLDHPLHTIDELADRLDLFLRQSTASYRDQLPKIHLVGHSMGGIVAATYALRKDKGVKITSVVALAAPLKGAKLARAAKWVFSKCGQEMAPESSLLKELSAEFDQADSATQFYYGAAQHDDLVPRDHVTLGGATPQVFPCNHMGIIYNNDARDLVETIVS